MNMVMGWKNTAAFQKIRSLESFPHYHSFHFNSWKEIPIAFCIILVKHDTL